MLTFDDRSVRWCGRFVCHRHDDDARFFYLYSVACQIVESPSSAAGNSRFLNLISATRRFTYAMIPNYDPEKHGDIDDNPSPVVPIYRPREIEGLKELMQLFHPGFEVESDWQASVILRGIAEQAEAVAEQMGLKCRYLEAPPAAIMLVLKGDVTEDRIKQAMIYIQDEYDAA